ncbi:MAG: hypothetical protein ABFE08_18175 [Armatimonadia bacterium]
MMVTRWTVALILLVVILPASLWAQATPAPARDDALAQAALAVEKGRVFFSGGALGADIGAVDLQSANVCDYTFSSAPTDWLVRSGEWNATNRWTCSPQWSWYGGYSPNGIAAMWNKREFMGDITVEAYVAFKMRLNRDPTYLHPNDLNITICGDGANPDSGYAFIVGGDDNRYTRIMRGTKVIAESRDPKALWPIYENGQPETYSWHRKWWSLRVRKQAQKLQVYLDEQLVLEGTDPNPLPGGRVGLWVLKNDMITPRVKIYYAKEKLPRDPMPPLLDPESMKATVREPELTISSPTHPSINNDFETSTGTFVTYDADQGALCGLADGGPDGTGHCLKLINRAAGGNFGVKISDRFDAKQLSQLAFDYKLSPDVKTNLYLTVADKPYEVVFSGFSEPAPGREILGQIPGVIADDKWHHASFDLLGALQKKQGLESSTVCTDVWIGNLSNKDYLFAGFGGNGSGATWYLDNFMLGQPGTGKVELAFTPRQGQEIEGYSVTVDQQANKPAPQTVTTKEATFKADLQTDGTYYAHVRPLLKDGKWGGDNTYRFGVDHTAPVAKILEPAGGGSLQDAPVVLSLSDAGGSGVDLAALKIDLGPTSLTIASPAVTYEPEDSKLIIDPRAAGLTVKDGDQIALALTGFSDRAGNATATPANWTFGADTKQDKAAPPAPKLQIGDGYLIDNDFEEYLGQWANYGGPGGAVLSRDSSTANSGKYSLKLYHTTAGRRFGAYVTQSPFDAGKHRIVSFAYKCDDRLRADLAVYVNGDWKGIKFTDNDNDLGVIGTVPNVTPDNQWHTTSFNLYDLLRADDPTAPTFIVRQFVIADWGWAGNRPGSTYHLDDFQLIPVMSGVHPVRLAWQAPDLSGIAGAAWALDALSSAVVPQTLSAQGEETNVTLAGLTDGWLNLRAQDKAGNWGPPTSRRLLVDSEAPTSQALLPAAGAKHAVSEIELALSDKGLAGIDPSSVRLKVAGTDYVMDGQGLRYRPTDGKLIWNCERVIPNPVVFPDQKQVDVELLAASDYAGNPVQTRAAWSWVMDYSLDKTPPRPAEIHSTTHPTLLTQTFEDGQVPWATRDGENGAKVEIDTTTAKNGSGSLKLTNQKAGGHMQATITTEAYDCEKYPVIAFDYRIPPATKLAFSVLLGGKWHAITLNDAATDVIGRVPGIIADNQWRHAAVELMPMLRRQQAQDALIVQQIIIGDRNTMDNAAGATAWFDNLIVGQVGKYPPVLRWRATDTTGIKGFSFALDQEPATVPDETPEGTEVAKSFDTMAPGVWYFHIRSQDGAGNWGPPTTYGLLHLKAD